MSAMMDLLNAIYPLPLGPVSIGADRCVELLNRAWPGEVHEFPSGAEHNGWTVPEKWGVVRAEIRRDGNLIYDGARHPLGVISHSQSFTGRVSLVELKSHLFPHPRLADALVFHCDLYYKPWRKDWGLSMPARQIDSLAPGEYDVELVTSFEPGTMKVWTADVHGETDEMVILNAHNCHPGQANDDISGVVVGLEVLKRLSSRRNRLSYRLVIGAEHFGTVFYVASLPPAEIARMRHGIFLEMLGNDNRLGIQQSFTGEAAVDRSAREAVRARGIPSESFGFRRFVGNDETVWEGPGVEVPMIELCRYPYPEYHSDKDTHEIISEVRLEESVGIVCDILDILETNVTVQRKFTGLLALSNPKYDLYHPAEDPSLGNEVSPDDFEWNHFMNCVVRYFDGKMSILEMAERHNLPYNAVWRYVNQFWAKGLVAMQAPSWAREDY